jgi:hypothetical protein
MARASRTGRPLVAAHRRWKGVLHAERGDPSVVLVCHPRADSRPTGYLYIHGHDMGEFENGVYARDSLYFEIIGFEAAESRVSGSRSLART